MLFWYIFWLIFQFLPFLCARRTNYSSVVSSSDIFLSASQVSIVSFWLFSWDSHVTPFSMANGQYISFPAVEGLQYFCGCPQNVRVLMSYFKAESWLYSTFMVELVTRHDRSLGCGNLITSLFFHNSPDKAITSLATHDTTEQKGWTIKRPGLQQAADYVNYVKMIPVDQRRPWRRFTES